MHDQSAAESKIETPLRRALIAGALGFFCSWWSMVLPLLAIIPYIIMVPLLGGELDIIYGDSEIPLAADVFGIAVACVILAGILFGPLWGVCDKYKAAMVIGLAGSIVALPFMWLLISDGFYGYDSDSTTTLLASWASISLIAALAIGQLTSWALPRRLPSATGVGLAALAVGVATFLSAVAYGTESAVLTAALWTGLPAYAAYRRQRRGTVKTTRPDEANDSGLTQST